MALDLRAIKADAARRLARGDVAGLANVAKPANAVNPVSQLAGLAGVAAGHERRHRDVLARLLRWGWPQADAEATAERIAARDADDDRRTCTECRHSRPGRCLNFREAGLGSADLGRDLAAMAQRCAGYAAASDTFERH